MIPVAGLNLDLEVSRYGTSKSGDEQLISNMVKHELLMTGIVSIVVTIPFMAIQQQVAMRIVDHVVVVCFNP